MGSCRRFLTRKFSIPRGQHGPLATARYSTTGFVAPPDAQPLTGGLHARPDRRRPQWQPDPTAAQLRDALEVAGWFFQTSVDSEIIIMMLGGLPSAASRNTLMQKFRHLEGAYSLIINDEKELIGARDPLGPPAFIGRLNGAYVLAKRIGPFDQIQAQFNP